MDTCMMLSDEEICWAVMKCILQNGLYSRNMRDFGGGGYLEFDLVTDFKNK